MSRKNIVLCVCGGVAAFKAVTLLRLFKADGFFVRVAMTPAARRFVGPLTFEALSGSPVVFDLWHAPHEQGMGGEPHIGLGTWADACVVAPATASTLAKMVQGQASDVVSATLLATKAPIVVAPAMHTHMLENPATQSNLDCLKARGMHIVPPTVGPLAQGFGPGRMAEPEVIHEHVRAALTPQDLAGRKIVVSAGPTREALDPVRFISNHSTGKMGYAVARMAWRRGGDVRLVSGPTELEPPVGVQVEKVVSAARMHEAIRKAAVDADVVIMAAAVSDYAPAHYSERKIKKSADGLTLTCRRTVDILGELGRERAERGGSGPLLVGFAMETDDLEARALAKMKAKGCDLMVANSLVTPGAGFGHDTNQVTLCDRQGGLERLPLMSKEDVAGRILDKVAELLGSGGS